MRELLASFQTKADNAPLPGAKVCVALAQYAAATFTKPTPRQSTALAKELFDCLPYLERKGIDLTVFLAKLVLIFEAHSLAAARHILDPVHGLIGREEFISLPKVNLALEKFEADQRQLLFAAEWALAEHERRTQALAQAEAIAAEQASFQKRHGVTPAEYARARLQ